MDADAAIGGAAAPAERVFKGVVKLARDNWAYVVTSADGVQKQYPGELSARRAADAYDAVVRSQGSRLVNTPLYPSDVQAVAGEDARVTIARWRNSQQAKCELKQQAQRPPPPPPPPPQPQQPPLNTLYRGVQQVGQAFSAFAYVGLARIRLGNYATAEEAAHAYNKEMYRQGNFEVNFPHLPGQIKAVPTAHSNHSTRSVPIPTPNPPPLPPWSKSAPAAADQGGSAQELLVDRLRPAAAAPAQQSVHGVSEHSPVDVSAHTPRYAHTSSGHRGVFHTPSGRWKAQLQCGSISTYLGTFDHEEEAARASDKSVLWANIHHPDHSNGVTNFPASQYAADMPALRAMTLSTLIQDLRRVGREQAIAKPGDAFEAAPAPSGAAAAELPGGDAVMGNDSMAAAPEKEQPAHPSVLLLRPRADDGKGDGDAAAMLVSSSGTSRERRPSGYYSSMVSPPQLRLSTRCDERKTHKKGCCGTPSASRLCLNRTPDMPLRRELPGTFVSNPFAPAPALPMLLLSKEEHARAKPLLPQQAMPRPEACRPQCSDPPPTPQPPQPPPQPAPQQACADDPASSVSLKVKLRCSPPSHAKPEQQPAVSKEVEAARFKGIQYRRASGVFQVMFQPAAAFSFATAQAAADAYDEIQRSRNLRVVNTPLHAGEFKAVRHELSRDTIARCARERQQQPQQQQPQQQGGVGNASYVPMLVRLPLPPCVVPSQPGSRPGKTHEPWAATAPHVAEQQQSFPPPPPPPPCPIVPPHSAPTGAKRLLSEAEAAPQHDAVAAEPPSKRAHTATPSAAVATEATPAATEAQQQHSGMAENDDVAVVLFLRAITPPLLNLDSVTAAAVNSGITLQMLRDACCVPCHGATNVQLICDILGVTLGRDKLMLQLAIQKL